MKEYILSILGIVLIGSLIDIIVPEGKTSKFIKGMYAIFVLAVIINPLSKLLKKTSFYIQTSSGVASESSKLIYDDIVANKEIYVKKVLEDNGILNVDIKLQYSIENDEIVIDNCKVNMKNIVIDLNRQHINKYDYIRKIINDCVGLDDEEIAFYE